MDYDPLAAALDGLGDDLLVMPGTIARRGVDEIDAEIEGLMQGGDRFIVGGGA